MTVPARIRWWRITPANVKAFAKGTWLKRRLEAHFNYRSMRANEGGAIRLVRATGLGGNHHIQLIREGADTIVAFDYLRFLGGGDKFNIYRTRLGPMISMFRQAQGVDSAMVDISDGEEVTAGIIGYDSRVDDAILIADNEFYDSHGYFAFRMEARRSARWADREGTFAWRGTTTGHGVIARDRMDGDDDTLLQRTRMCVLLRDRPGTDVKFVGVVQSREPQRDEARLRAAGLLAGRIPPSTWGTSKYALIVDGNAGSWVASFVRHLLGCCVIRIASRYGWRQWYHGDLRPWEHFVPVEPDMSDLIERIEWCRANERECAEIAARGQDFAMRRTFETEVGGSIARIEAALGRGARQEPADRLGLPPGAQNL